LFLRAVLADGHVLADVRANGSTGALAQAKQAQAAEAAI
jgi:hypothetical protein